MEHEGYQDKLSQQSSNEAPMMPQGIRPGEIPPFHKLGEYVFQDMCRDIFDAETDVAVCEIYGTRGQSQDGIDLLAYRNNGDGVEVGQCKCYEKFEPNEINTASDDFFAYWDDHWSKEDVKRFILFVGSDLSKTQQQNKILEQIKRFKSFGIAYEAWSAAKIRNKLRPHEGIVRTYCVPPDHWVQVICGAASPTSSTLTSSEPQTSVIVSKALLSQLDQLVAHASTHVEQQMELMRKAWREGKRDEAVNWVKDLKGNHSLWSPLSPEAKAKVLRFEASLEIDITGEVKRAKQLADEALLLCPSSDQARLRSLIARKESGAEEAIKILDGHEDIDSLNLKAAFLLEMGRIQESLAVLNIGSGGPESDE